MYIMSPNGDWEWIFLTRVYSYEENAIQYFTNYFVVD